MCGFDPYLPYQPRDRYHQAGDSKHRGPATGFPTQGLLWWAVKMASWWDINGKTSWSHGVHLQKDVGLCSIPDPSPRLTARALVVSPDEKSWKLMLGLWDIQHPIHGLLTWLNGEYRRYCHAASTENSFTRWPSRTAGNGINQQCYVAFTGQISTLL